MLSAREACTLSKESEKNIAQDVIARIENDISEACKKGLFEIDCKKYVIYPEVKKHFEDLGYCVEECKRIGGIGGIVTDTYISWYEEDI